jgi:hypothetical protein
LYENIEGDYYKINNCSAYLWKKPRGIYISNMRYMGMSLIALLKEGSSYEDNGNFLKIISKGKIR